MGEFGCGRIRFSEFLKHLQDTLSLGIDLREFSGVTRYHQLRHGCVEHLLCSQDLEVGLILLKFVFLKHNSSFVSMVLLQLILSHLLLNFLFLLGLLKTHQIFLQLCNLRVLFFDLAYLLNQAHSSGLLSFLNVPNRGRIRFLGCSGGYGHLLNLHFFLDILIHLLKIAKSQVELLVLIFPVLHHELELVVEALSQDTVSIHVGVECGVLRLLTGRHILE